MAERTLSHVNYGHAGAATFDLEQQEWSFGRHPTTRKLIQIGIKDRIVPGSSEALPPPIQFPSTTVSTRLTDARGNLQVFLQDHPQIAPASGLLPRLAVTSAAIVSATATYDPLIGSLFSTGSITLEARSGKWENPRRVAATVAGEAGNILRLTFLYKETLGWGVDKNVWIRGDTLRDTESGYWNEEAAPIQQVCFAQTEDRSSLLAVRFLTRTVIFRPFYSRRPRSASHSPYYNLPPSPIVAHQILSLENCQSGGSPHSDVAFNPDFQLQFAVVDHDQTWSVWDINNGRKGDEYTLSRLVQGQIMPPDDPDLPGEDGWARILWVGDVNTILVCNRRHISIIGLKGSSFAYLPCPTLCSKGTSDWILDVKRHPLLKNRFLVLTSTSLILLAVTTSSEAVDATAEPGAWILISWRHYRGAEDITLGISVHVLDENDLCVLLHSRLNNLVQTYFFSNLSSCSPVTTNPTSLDIAVNKTCHNLQWIVEPLHFQGDIHSNSPSLGRSYFASGLQFYKLFVLRSDHSVHEMVVCACPSSDRGTSLDQSLIEDLSWSVTYRPRKKTRSIRNLEELDDFVVAEGVEALESPLSRLVSQAPQWLRGSTSSAVNRWADLRLVYDALIQTPSSADTFPETVDVVDVTTRVKQLLLGTPNVSQLPLGTLIEFAGMELAVPDIDEASSSLHDLLPSAVHLESVAVCHIASAQLLHLGEGEQITMSGLYDNILQSWVAPLSPDIAIRIRTRKERLARRIAAEITLASSRIRQQDPQAQVIETTSDANREEGISMAILPSQPLSGSPIKSTAWPQSSSLPTIPSSQLQSSLPSSQIQYTLQQATPASEDPLSDLRKHLKFRDDAPASASIPASVNQLLAHWEHGTDPRDYDWETLERTSQTESLDEESQQQLEKAREKARRKKERLERRQQRENEIARTQPSSQPFVFEKPTAFPRSSPGPMVGGIGSSSQVTGQPHVPLPSSQGGFGLFGVQSQVEPGKFGGRADKKKKKKGRVSGF